MIRGQGYGVFTKGAVELLRPVYAEYVKRGCEAMGIPEEVVMGQSRKEEIIIARYAIIHTLRRQLKMKPFHIALLMGRHHTTILNALKQIYYFAAYSNSYRTYKAKAKAAAVVMLAEDATAKQMKKVFKYYEYHNQFTRGDDYAYE